MKTLIDRTLLYLKIILILWIPILLIEETSLFNIVDKTGISFICTIPSFMISFYIYVITCTKKVQDKSINCYKYNIFNTIILGIINIFLGYYFVHLIDIGIFHQCPGSGWDCFMFGIEYLIFGIEYALLSAIILIIWLIVKLIKKIKLKNKCKV